MPRRLDRARQSDGVWRGNGWRDSETRTHPRPDFDIHFSSAVGPAARLSPSSTQRTASPFCTCNQLHDCNACAGRQCGPCGILFPPRSPPPPPPDRTRGDQEHRAPCPALGVRGAVVWLVSKRMYTSASRTFRCGASRRFSSSQDEKFSAWILNIGGRVPQDAWCRTSGSGETFLRTAIVIDTCTAGGAT